MSYLWILLLGSLLTASVHAQGNHLFEISSDVPIFNLSVYLSIYYLSAWSICSLSVHFTVILNHSSVRTLSLAQTLSHEKAVCGHIAFWTWVLLLRGVVDQTREELLPSFTLIPLLLLLLHISSLTLPSHTWPVLVTHAMIFKCVFRMGGQGRKCTHFHKISTKIGWGLRETVTVRRRFFVFFHHDENISVKPLCVIMQTKALLNVDEGLVTLPVQFYF